MCGIVGYIGKENAKEILIDGLRHLEYRGYDSAGIALLGEKIRVVKAVGKVQNLAAKLSQDNDPETIGIAHTRWATHGAPEEKNAHPHLDDSKQFAVVHNGIIDNYTTLRKQLIAKGHSFLSDTDSEVIPHLIAEFYHGDFVKAVAAALQQLHGTYAIAAISSLHPDMMITARLGSPIVIGLGVDSNIVASDITALVAHTKNVIYLNDGEMGILTRDNVQLRTLTNIPIEHEISQITWDIETAGKSGYEHFMLKEMHEQPASISDTIRGRLNFQLGNAILSGLNMSTHSIAKIDHVVIVGCGSSLHAGLIGEYYFEDIANIPTKVEQAAEFRYRNPIIEPSTLVIPISQSGETADTLAAVREALNKGAVVTAISNVVGSTIARESGRGIYLHAGPEIGVASTKAFTCQVTMLLLMALLFGRNRRLSCEEGIKLVHEIESIPDLIQQVLDTAPAIEQIAYKYKDARAAFYIGRGTLYPVALEGALKLKEISYVHAEGYNAAELKHGPIALLDQNVPIIALANNVPGQDKIIGNIQECIARKAPIIAVVSGPETSIETLTSDLIRVPDSSRFIAPLTTAVALQLFAYYSAKARGCDIDQPRNLAKSVTVE
ncbi:MAG: glutamine--fructose-6-phosphate transaminase (isomerizing) [Lentisphaeria bacterium]